jgi:pimeloyl-ACP methyl ester carboxylesterase
MTISTKAPRQRFALNGLAFAGIGIAALMTGFAAPAQALAPTEAGTAYIAEIERVECPFNAPRGDVAVCFEATVPTFYEDVAADGILPKDAPRLTIAVTVLSNFIEVDDPDPIVMLAGGPGQGSTMFVPAHGPALQLRRSRSIVMIDQRGTGASSPLLACDAISVQEFDENRLNDPDLMPETPAEERLAQCIADWRDQGIDFNAFDTRATTRDLQAIRRGFGIRQWNLHGTSYGARVVLDAMRVDPEGIRSVVLNSPQAITAHFDEAFADNRAILFGQFFADCAQDAYCSETYGDLEAHLEKIRAHLADEGMDIYLRETPDGALIRITVGWEDVIEGLYGHMNFVAGPTPVARYIHELSRMVDGRLSLNDDEIARIFQGALQDDDMGIAMGLHFAVRCREDVDAYDDDVVAAGVAKAPSLYTSAETIHSYRLGCAMMEIEPVDASFHEMVESDIPALVLTGDMDPLTPTIWAHDAAEALDNAQLVSFRALGHDIYSSSVCARVITANFIDAPGEPVDATCAEIYRPVFAPAQ